MKFLILILIPLFAFGFPVSNDRTLDADNIKALNQSDTTFLNPVKVDTYTGNFVLQSSGAKVIEESAVTNTELSFLSGVTSSIQTQIDSKTPLTRLITTTAPIQIDAGASADLSVDRTLSILQAGIAQDGYLSSTDWNTFNGKQDALPLTTSGDLLYHNGTNLARLGIGTSGQALIVNAGLVATWQDVPDPSPTAVLGDIIYNNGAGDVALNIGTAGQLLTVFSGSVAWRDAPVSTTLDTKGDLQGFSTVNAKIAVGTDGQVLSADSSEATGVKWIAPPASSPTTNVGDLIVNTLGTAGGDTALAVGTNGQFLIADSNETLGMKWSDTLSGIFNPVTDTIAWTPSCPYTTAATCSGRYYRIGEYLHGEIAVTFSGTNTENINAIFTIPNGLVIDTTKMIGSDVSSLDDGSTCADASSTNYNCRTYFISNTSVILRYASDGSTEEQYNSVNPFTLKPFTVANNDKYISKFKVPIVGWSSGNDAIAQNISPILLKYSLSSPQTIGTSMTTVIFNSVVSSIGDNSGGMYNSGTGVYTNTSSRDLYLDISGQILNTAPNGYSSCRIYHTSGAKYQNQDRNAVSEASKTSRVHGIVKLEPNDTLDFRCFSGNAANQASSGETDSNITIREINNKQVIAAQIDSQKWECQTKALGANTSSTGVMSDLTFNNLEVGKKYKYAPNLRVAHGNTTSNEKYAVVNAYDGVTALDSMYTRSNPIEKHHADLDTSIMYTATGTTLTFDLVVSTNILLIGNGSSLNSSVTLCQLPDNYNLTSNKWD